MSSDKSTHSTAGYFYLKITHSSEGRFLRTNNERAYVISQLQDLLYMRSVLEDPTPYKRLASHIDLLAFSLNLYSVELVVFSISKNSAQALAEIIASRLNQYQDEHPLRPHVSTTFPVIYLRSLRGPHHALATTIQIHKNHEDWEYDRYSSIGFYLHDRRGDWMRIWRLTQLYNSDPTVYRKLLIQLPSLVVTKADHQQVAAP